MGQRDQVGPRTILCCVRPGPAAACTFCAADLWRGSNLLRDRQAGPAAGTRRRAGHPVLAAHWHRPGRTLGIRSADLARHRNRGIRAQRDSRLIARGGRDHHGGKHHCPDMRTAAAADSGLPVRDRPQAGCSGTGLSRRAGTHAGERNRRHRGFTADRWHSRRRLRNDVVGVVDRRRDGSPRRHTAVAGHPSPVAAPSTGCPGVAGSRRDACSSVRS